MMKKVLLVLACLFFGFCSSLRAGESSTSKLDGTSDGKITMGDGLTCEVRYLGYDSLQEVSNEIKEKIETNLANIDRLLILDHKQLSSQELTLYFSLMNKLSLIEKNLQSEIDSYAEPDLKMADEFLKGQDSQAGEENKNNSHPGDTAASGISIANAANIDKWTKLFSLFKIDEEYKAVKIENDTASLIAMVAKKLKTPTRKVFLPGIMAASCNSKLLRKFEIIDTQVKTAKSKIKNVEELIANIDEKVKILEAHKSKNYKAIIEVCMFYRNRLFSSVKNILQNLENFAGLKNEVMAKENTVFWKTDQILSSLNSTSCILFLECIAIDGTNKSWRPFLQKGRFQHSSSAIARFFLLLKNGELIDADVVKKYHSFQKCK